MSPRPGAPQWEGDRLDGRKIFLHSELDGFGDAIHMARYIPMVKAMGGHVTLVCHPTQGRLFIRAGDRLGLDCLVAKGARVAAAAMEHDVQAGPLAPAGDLQDHAGDDPARSLARRG